MDGIPGTWIVQGGATAILAVAVLLVLGGWLVPRRTLTDCRKDRDDWREIALKLSGQNAELLEGARVGRDVSRALTQSVSTAQDRESP